VGEDDSVSKLLDEAENIINSAAPDIQKEIDPVGFRFATKKKKWWWPFS